MANECWSLPLAAGKVRVGSRRNANEQRRRLEAGGSPQQARWHVGRRKTGQNGPGRGGNIRTPPLDPERSDVLSKIRKDFDAAGVVQSDEQIVQVMDDFMSSKPGT